MTQSGPKEPVSKARFSAEQVREYRVGDVFKAFEFMPLSGEEVLVELVLSDPVQVCPWLFDDLAYLSRRGVIVRVGISWAVTDVEDQ